MALSDVLRESKIAGNGTTLQGALLLNIEDPDRRPLPIGTVTFLLADIERSVQHWEDQAAMQSALASFDDLVDSSILRHGGARPVEQGEGDSFVAAFPRASDGVASALDLQLAIAKQPWSRGLDLQVRMALHTGDTQLRDDGRYWGQAINRCARLRSLAHGGQTLLSRTTHDLVADAPPEGAALLDVGEHRLRDLERPERVYQLTHPDLPVEFPMLRSLDAIPNNLPVQLTTFVGREAEVKEVKNLLERTRALTLTGAGGCGKTRLSLEVGADLVEAFPDGVWWVDLAPVTDPALVPGTLAAALGITESSREGVLESVIRSLKERRLLVLLDNCEHLISTCAEVAETILKSCGYVSVLATSREALGIEGETSLRVPSLALPETEDDNLDRLAACESVTLFVDRAARARPNFRLTKENAEPVIRICHRLDGIPLAIELAAARTRMLSPQQIAEGLSDRFHLLTGGARTALPRQRTLEASVDWSYQLLNDSERSVLARASVFAGGFELQAAEEVCSGGEIDQYHVLELLSSLVEKSLIQVEEAEPEARYRLLETIRVYARQKLTDSAESPETRTRHLDYYAKLAEESEPKLRGREVAVWSRRLEAELDNLRAALDWAIASDQAEKHLRITGSLLTFWILQSLFSEVRLTMEAALSASASDPRVRAKALSTAALVTVMSGNYPMAQVLASECVEISRETGDSASLQLGLMFLGWAEYWNGKNGLGHTIESHRLAAESGDPLVLQRIELYRGVAEMTLNGPSFGRPYLEGVIGRSKAIEDFYILGVVHFFAGACEVFAGNFDASLRHFEESIEACRPLGNGTFHTQSLSYLGLVEIFQGRYESAKTHLDEAVAMSRDLGLQAWEVASMNRAMLPWVTGSRDPDPGTLISAANVWRHAGNHWLASSALWMLGARSLTASDLAGARRYLGEAEDLSRSGGFKWPFVRVLTQSARLARTEGELDSSEKLIYEALQVSFDHGDPAGSIDCLEEIAALATELESCVEATRLNGAAERLREELGYVRFPVYEPSYKAILENCRAALGEAGFAAAREEGKAMSLGEVVTFALRGRGERKRPSAGWESLTPTEMEVVRLVARGLPNPEIAKQLFVTRNTIKTHLSHVFGKLGISTRAELAAKASTRVLPAESPREIRG